MKKYFLLFLALFMLNGCNSVNEDKNQEYFTISRNEIEVYDDISLNDLIDFKMTNTDFILISKNYRIDTNEVGTKTYEVEYEVNRKKYVHKFDIKVLDTEAPRVFGGTNKTVLLNYNGDLCNLITYGDNYDGIIKCEISGEYDLNKVGTYKLHYNLTDSSDNLKEVNVTLNVIEKRPATNNTSEPKKTQFNDVIKNYKNENNEIGIDVSKWQGEIDFKKVKNAGATFVMMRMGVQKKVNGDLELDKYFLQNIENAKKEGLKVGVYLYSIATSSEEAIEQANWVLKNLNKQNLDLGVVFDWESWAKWNSFKISFHEINSIANNFMTTIRNNGYDAMLYSSKFYLESIWTNKLEYPVWLAHYTSKTNYEGNYKMWQICNNGRIDGINGDVDIDILYK